MDSIIWPAAFNVPVTVVSESMVAPPTTRDPPVTFKVPITVVSESVVSPVTSNVDPRDAAPATFNVPSTVDDPPTIRFAFIDTSPPSKIDTTRLVSS